MHVTFVVLSLFVINLFQLNTASVLFIALFTFIIYYHSVVLVILYLLHIYYCVKL